MGFLDYFFCYAPLGSDLLSNHTYTHDVEKVTCIACWQELVQKAGLTIDTPKGIVADRLKEMEYESRRSETAQDDHSQT